MVFDFSGVLGLLILFTLLCLIFIVGQSIRWTVRGQRMLARAGHHTCEGLQEFWGGLALLLVSLFLSSIILSLHTNSNLVSGILLVGATTFFLLDIAVCAYWKNYVPHNRW